MPLPYNWTPKRSFTEPIINIEKLPFFWYDSQ